MTAWRNILKLGQKLLIGELIALGIEIACLVLYLTHIIPMWGWLISVIAWVILVSIWLGTHLSLKEIQREELGKHNL